LMKASLWKTPLCCHFTGWLQSCSW
jgi:hypothetical protein